MALEKNLLFKLLDYLENLISQVESKEVTLNKLEEGMDFMFAVERRMQLMIETTINIAEHIVAGLNLAHPETAKDVFFVLGKEGIITQELAQKLANAAGFRNILGHDYLDVDLKIVAEASTTGLDDLRQFATCIRQFIEKQHN